METFLTFTINENYYAVNVDNVLEVIDEIEITPVPKASEHILGIINFRGEIIPTINTHIRLNQDIIADKNKQYVVVYEINTGDNTYHIAATANGVKDVLTLTPDKIKTVPEMGLNYDHKYLKGVFKLNEHFVLIIDPNNVFSLSVTEAINITNQ